MKNPRQQFMSKLFDLPKAKQDYPIYFFSLKFIWAPLLFLITAVYNWFKTSFFSNPNPNNRFETIPLYAEPALQPEKSDLAIKPFVEEMIANYASRTACEIGNTPLTAYLAKHVFQSSKNYHTVKDEIHNVLSHLCQLAQTSSAARQLLVAPNTPPTVTPRLVNMGLPINTPLMLLIKAGDIENAKLIIPFYQQKDLELETPRQNTVFHIAAMTAQQALLNELIRRANSLNMPNPLKSYRNINRYTPEDMLNALMQCNTPFKNFLDFADDYLGGEEVNKAACTDSGRLKVFEIRRELLKQPHTTYISESEIASLGPYAGSPSRQYGM